MSKSKKDKLIVVELTEEEKELFKLQCVASKKTMSEVIRGAIAPEIEKARELKEKMNG